MELFYGVSDKGEMVAQPFKIGYKVNKYAAAFGFAVFVVKTFDMSFDKHLLALSTCSSISSICDRTETSLLSTHDLTKENMIFNFAPCR